MEQRERRRFILKNFIYALAVLGFFVLGEIPGFNPLWAKTIPVVSIVVSLAMQEGEMAGGFFGFFAGLLIDTYASHVFGLACGIFTILGTLCGLLVMFLLQDNLRTSVILTFSFTGIYSLICYYVIYAMWQAEGRGYMFMTRTIPTVLVSSLWAFAAYPLVRTIKLKFLEGGRK